MAAGGEAKSGEAKRRPAHMVYNITEGKLDVVIVTRSPTKAMEALQEDRTRSFIDLMID